MTVMVGVLKSYLTFLHCMTQVELNMILLLACGMQQWKEGVTVGGWLSVRQLGG